MFLLRGVYSSLLQKSVGAAVNSTTPGGTLVSLLSADQSLVVAHGHVTPDRPPRHLGVNVTKTRVLVTVTSIIIPGHIVSGELLPSHADTPLSEFPQVPFKHALQGQASSYTIIRSGKLNDTSPPVSPTTASNSHPISLLSEPSQVEGPRNPDQPTSEVQQELWFEDLDDVDLSEQ
jgi:hypothetical protein